MLEILPPHPAVSADETANERPAPRRDGPRVLWRHVLGDRLRALRHERGETLGEVAERAGVSPQYLSEVERGRKEPSSEMIEAIAGALDLDLLDLTLAVSERLAGGRDAPTATTCSVGLALVA